MQRVREHQDVLHQFDAGAKFFATGSVWKRTDDMSLVQAYGNFPELQSLQRHLRARGESRWTACCSSC